MRHVTKVIAITAAMLCGLTACSATDGDTTLAASQKTVDSTFTTWAKQIRQTDVLRTKAHAGRTTLGADCTKGKVQLLDARAIYVTKDFDGKAFLKTFQTYLKSHGGEGTTGVDSNGNPALNVNRGAYAYQVLSLSNVKIASLDTSKAILFAVTGPCVQPK